MSTSSREIDVKTFPLRRLRKVPLLLSVAPTSPSYGERTPKLVSKKCRRPCIKLWTKEKLVLLTARGKYTQPTRLYRPSQVSTDISKMPLPTDEQSDAYEAHLRTLTAEELNTTFLAGADETRQILDRNIIANQRILSQAVSVYDGYERVVEQSNDGGGAELGVCFAAASRGGMRGVWSGRSY